MNNTIKFSVDTRNSGKRLDVFLTENIDNYTRSFLKKIIENKQVKLNNSFLISPSTKVKFKDQITVNIVQKSKQDIIPKKIKLDLIFEDKDILVLNKPKGMVVHPGAGNNENTLVNALLFKYKKNLSNINGTLRPGIVHRIDKETSGLLVIAFFPLISLTVINWRFFLSLEINVLIFPLRGRTTPQDKHKYFLLIVCLLN